MKAKDIIEQLQLIPHPEGGYYRQTYRSEKNIIVSEGINRHLSTAIYYLLEDNDRSHFHRIKSDELWFFHTGEPLEIISIINNKLSTIILGNDLTKGESPQALIPANTWFGARLKNGTGFSLVSCTVAPGFDFADFELAKREELVTQFPHLKEVVEMFTRETSLI